MILRRISTTLIFYTLLLLHTSSPPSFTNHLLLFSQVLDYIFLHHLNMIRFNELLDDKLNSIGLQDKADYEDELAEVEEEWGYWHDKAEGLNKTQRWKASNEWRRERDRLLDILKTIDVIEDAMRVKWEKERAQKQAEALEEGLAWVRLIFDGAELEDEAAEDEQVVIDESVEADHDDRQDGKKRRAEEDGETDSDNPTKRQKL